MSLISSATIDIVCSVIDYDTCLPILLHPGGR
jgi:hypothetical protein